ncbi:MAG: efflux RND transporter periplasmic adaptor subunit [Owenweeksia sp.]
MKINRKTIIVMLLTLVTGLLMGWLIFGGSSGQKMEEDHQHTNEIAGETIWTCSMHPQIRQNEPGDCPICGMDLIPLENDDNQELDPMAISMSPTAMQLASVSTAIVGTTAPVKSVRLNGKIQEDERLVFSQTSHIPGRIEQLKVNFTGEYVRKGQVIASLYSPELVTAQEELFEAQKIKATQPALYQSAREKLKNWKLSEAQIEEILEEGETKEQFPIVADVSGYVISKNVNLGDYIRKGEAIYEIADLSKVWVLFDVYESDLAWIKKGDKVNFTVASLPGQEFNGTISFLDPVIDPRTRVAKARVEATNKGNTLKPEMFASGVVQAALENKANTLIVPKSAVMWTGERSVVYVKTPSDNGMHFMMREVVLGPEMGEGFIIKQGLEPGEEIAVHGTFSIDAAAQLAGKPSMMNPEGGPAMTGHNHGGNEMPSAASPVKPKTVQSFTIDQKAEKSLRPLYTTYLDFKNALVADQLVEAKQYGGQLATAIEKVDMALFTGAAHNAWMEYSRTLKKALEHLPHFKSMEEIRGAFQQVSEGMINLTRSFTPFDTPLYIQHCPMADSNKGADWLSIKAEIKNPYFGEAMLTCGEITDTIK